MSKLLKQSALYAIGEIVPKLVSFFLLPIISLKQIMGLSVILTPL